MGEGLRILRRLACYKGSTSGVEQTFSVLQQVTKGCHYSPFGRLMLATVATSAGIADDSKLVAAARLIWQETFGTPHRFAKRARLQQAKGSKGEKGWLRQKSALRVPPRGVAYLGADGLSKVKGVRKGLWDAKQQKGVAAATESAEGTRGRGRGLEDARWPTSVGSP